MTSVLIKSHRLLCLLIFVLAVLAAKTASALPAFPGAEGFGSDTVGGRGGDVYTVTTLDWSGPGSFAEALYEKTGPRTIVFAVSGVIEVPADSIGNYELTAENSYVTVAGQTSPGGITFQMTGEGATALWSYNLTNDEPPVPFSDNDQFHDAVFRHLRFRGVGNTDNVSLAGVHNIIFDHCDFSGADDESLDITFAHDITIQNSTITNSGRTSGENSKYGFLLAYPPSDNLSFHHNLTANHGDRCGAHIHWEFGGTPDGGADIDIRNNVMYNCWHESFFYPSTDTQPQHEVHLNFVGNTMLVGPNSAGPGKSHSTTGMLGFYRQSTSVYATDNVFPDAQFPGGQRPLFVEGYSTPTVVNTAFDYGSDNANVTTQGVATAQTLVMDTAGAWPRDNMNQRTIDEINTKTGSLGNSSSILTTATSNVPSDSDGDGMADTWEQQHGLNVGSNDANVYNSDGYTHLEHYLNELADGTTGTCSATSDGQGLSCSGNDAASYNVSGAWYDPTYDGSGFVIMQTPVGTAISYYGYKGGADGNTQWLVSELISGTALEEGRTYNVRMRSGYPGNGGSFTNKPNLPTPEGDGAQYWGRLSIRFDSCTQGQATLIDDNDSDGDDGSVTMSLQLLYNLKNVDCSGDSSATSGFYISGIWYDPSFNGSGFYISETPAGLMSSFYGYKGSGNGDAFWLVSDVLPASTTIERNTPYTFVERSGFIGNGGSFATRPDPAPGTKIWGNMNVVFDSCNTATLTLTDSDNSDGDYGSRTYSLIRLIGVEGLICDE